MYRDVDMWSDFEAKLLLEKVEWDCDLKADMLAHEKNRRRRIEEREKKLGKFLRR